MPEISPRLVYSEPTVMWRMYRPGGIRSHAMIGTRPGGAVVIWFVNDHPMGQREFGDLASALRWSEQMQAQNWAAGWRLVPD